MDKHPLDIDIYEMAQHMRNCERCRKFFARVLYPGLKMEDSRG